LILSQELKDIIAKHINDDPFKLSLKAGKSHVWFEAIAQIQARQKATKKLPTWVANQQLVFPPLLSVEQGSSELTAQFKASLVAGKRLADLTGGMAVDCWAMSKGFEAVDYVEQNHLLVNLAKHNLNELERFHIEYHHAVSIDFLRQTPHHFDWVYLDPARRNDRQQKVVLLEDCEPNIVAIQEKILEKTDNILLKVSPMLDIDLAIRQLKTVKSVYVVAVQDEVKELLFHLNKELTESPEIHAIVLSEKKSQQHFSYQLKDETNAPVALQEPKIYLYEPSVALLKAGAFKLVANRWQLAKLHPHSHLYTANEYHPDFMGRIFRIKEIAKLDKNTLRNLVPTKKAHIAVRNFPSTVAEIRKQIGFADGGDVYLFATTDSSNRKIVIVTEKV
jgi:16S rRNA G966 N2-methylase RsmD